MRAWTADEADRAVGLIHGWLESIKNSPDYASIYGFAMYETKFSNALFAEGEALLRFPNAPQANAWKWESAHDLAVTSGSSDAVLNNYAQFMQGPLIRGKFRLRLCPRGFPAMNLKSQLC
jgi:hypothetical protein